MPCPKTLLLTSEIQNKTPREFACQPQISSKSQFDQASLERIRFWSLDTKHLWTQRGASNSVPPSRCLQPRRTANMWPDNCGVISGTRMVWVEAQVEPGEEALVGTESIAQQPRPSSSFSYLCCCCNRIHLKEERVILAHGFSPSQ